MSDTQLIILGVLVGMSIYWIYEEKQKGQVLRKGSTFTDPSKKTPKQTASNTSKISVKPKPKIRVSATPKIIINSAPVIVTPKPRVDLRKERQKKAVQQAADWQMTKATW